MKEAAPQESRLWGCFQIPAYLFQGAIMNTVSVTKSRKAAFLSVRTISMTAMLAAVAYLLAFLEFPVPLSPSFARMD